MDLNVIQTSQFGIIMNIMGNQSSSIGISDHVYFDGWVLSGYFATKYGVFP